MNKQPLHGSHNSLFWVLLLAFVSLAGASAPTLASSSATSMKMLAATDFAKPGLRGGNLGTRQSPPLGEADFQDLADTGANLVRIILPLQKCKSCITYGIAPADLAYADQVVAMGEKLGFYVVLTLSPQPAGDKAKYWSDAGLQESIRDNWAQLSAHYRGRVGIAGYDLINEPVPNVWYDKQGAWRGFSSSLIEAIRKNDPEHVIVVEPNDWGHVQGMKDWTPLPYPNLVYSFHFYEPYKLTHQGLYENREVITYPNVSWDKERLSKMLEPARIFSAKYKVPLLVGEFSIVRWAPGNSVHDYLHDAIDLFEKEGWPWIYHSFRESPAWDAEMPNSVEREPANRRSARRSDTPAMQLLRESFTKN
jgi:hypothetical protein